MHYGVITTVNGKLACLFPTSRVMQLNLIWIKFNIMVFGQSSVGEWFHVPPRILTKIMFSAVLGLGVVSTSLGPQTQILSMFEVPLHSFTKVVASEFGSTTLALVCGSPSIGSVNIIP